jgi:hypothetical protein
MLEVADCLEKALEAVPEEKRSANADLQTVFEGMELIDKVTYLIAQILCKSYASLTQVLRKSYASLTQVLRKSYASLTQVLRMFSSADLQSVLEDMEQLIDKVT